MFHGDLDYFQKPLLVGRSNTKPGVHSTLNAHIYWFILFNYVWGPAWINLIEIAFGRGPGHTWLHTWGFVTHYMILEVSWDGLWTLPFGLSQFRNHGSWLMCEVALISTPKTTGSSSYGYAHIDFILLLQTSTCAKIQNVFIKLVHSTSQVVQSTLGPKQRNRHTWIWIATWNEFWPIGTIQVPNIHIGKPKNAFIGHPPLSLQEFRILSYQP